MKGNQSTSHRIRPHRPSPPPLRSTSLGGFINLEHTYTHTQRGWLEGWWQMCNVTQLAHANTAGTNWYAPTLGMRAKFGSLGELFYD